MVTGITDWALVIFYSGIFIFLVSYLLSPGRATDHRAPDYVSRIDRCSEILGLSSNGNSIDHKSGYTLVKWEGLDTSRCRNKFWKYADRRGAYDAAKECGQQREPVFHEAHGVGKRDHYHLHDHYYIEFEEYPNILYNVHFRFGKTISQELYDTRQRRGKLKQAQM